jgi:hypothetical protein
VATDAKAKDGRDALDTLLGRAARKAKASRLFPALPSRGDEPSDDEILRVIDGSCSSEERRRVESAGPWTQARVEILRDALTESGEAVPTVVKAARYVMTIARESLEFLRGATSPLPAPAHVQLRSQSQSQGQTPQSFLEFRHSFASIDAEIRIEHVSQSSQTSTIDLQVKLVNSGNPVSNGRVAVLRKGRVVDSVPLESDGSATFTGLPPERYQVELRARGEVAGTLDIEFL